MANELQQPRTNSGLERSAIFLLAIGEEQAAQIMRYLDANEVRKVSEAMASLQNVSGDRIAQSLSAFVSRCEEGMVTGSSEYLRKTLTKALGKRQGEALLSRINPSSGGVLSEYGGLQNLKWMDPRSLAELVRHEHPQVVAMILSLIESDQASEVLEMLPTELSFEATQRMATLEGVQPGALRELADALNEQLTSEQESINFASFGGIESAAELLNRLDAKRADEILEKLQEADPDLAEEIQDRMFVFTDLYDLDDRSMQVLLREVESSTLLLAIKSTSAELQEKIFNNMSKRAAEILRDDLEAKGPVRMSEVEASQKEVLKIARRLAEQGQIILSSSGSEEMV